MIDDSDDIIEIKSTDVPKSAYTASFEVQLDVTDFGKSRSYHYQVCNRILLEHVREFAQEGHQFWPDISNEQLIKNLEKSPHKSPHPSLVWEHCCAEKVAYDKDSNDVRHDIAKRQGVMRLVPKAQHNPQSEFWRTLHPYYKNRGGYHEWAIPNGAPTGVPRGFPRVIREKAISTLEFVQLPDALLTAVATNNFAKFQKIIARADQLGVSKETLDAMLTMPYVVDGMGKEKHLIHFAVANGNAKFIIPLVSAAKGAHNYLNAVDSDGNSLAHLAASNNRYSILQRLQLFGVDLTKRNNKNQTVEDVAQARGHVACLQFATTGKSSLYAKSHCKISSVQSPKSAESQQQVVPASKITFRSLVSDSHSSNADVKQVQHPPKNASKNIHLMFHQKQNQRNQNKIHAQQLQHNQQQAKLRQNNNLPKSQELLKEAPKQQIHQPPRQQQAQKQQLHQPQHQQQVQKQQLHQPPRQQQIQKQQLHQPQHQQQVQKQQLQQSQSQQQAQKQQSQQHQAHQQAQRQQSQQRQIQKQQLQQANQHRQIQQKQIQQNQQLRQNQLRNLQSNNQRLQLQQLRLQQTQSLRRQFNQQPQRSIQLQLQRQLQSQQIIQQQQQQQRQQQLQQQQMQLRQQQQRQQQLQQQRQQQLQQQQRQQQMQQLQRQQQQMLQQRAMEAKRQAEAQAKRQTELQRQLEQRRQAEANARRVADQRAAEGRRQADIARRAEQQRAAEAQRRAESIRQANAARANVAAAQRKR